jgi:hypothetical protein
MKLVRLIKMCLNETYSKHLSDRFPIKNGFKQDALSPLLFNFVLEYAIMRKVKFTQEHTMKAQRRGDIALLFL